MRCDAGLRKRLAQSFPRLPIDTHSLLTLSIPITFAVVLIVLIVAIVIVIL